MRHLSWVENGRSTPSPDLLERLAEAPDIPARDRQALYLSAGHAPPAPETTTLSPALVEVLARIGDAAMPAPVVVMDRRWSIVFANATARGVMDLLPAHLTTGEVSAMRVLFEPDGLGTVVENIRQVREQMRDRVVRQARVDGGDEMRRIAAYVQQRFATAHGIDPSSLNPSPLDDLAVVMRITIGGQRLRFLSTIATFGSPVDVVTSELMIETFYPADDDTADILST